MTDMIFIPPFQSETRAASSLHIDGQSIIIALCVFVNGELALGFLELSPSFYGF